MSLFRLRVSGIATAIAFAFLPATSGFAEPHAGYENFEAYEVAMYQRIDELAEQRGVDIAFLYEDRDALRAEYAEAEKRNDKAGMAEARAMQTYVILFALEKLSE